MLRFYKKLNIENLPAPSIINYMFFNKNAFFSPKISFKTEIYGFIFSDKKMIFFVAFGR